MKKNCTGWNMHQDRMIDGCPLGSGVRTMMCLPEREFGYLFRDGAENQIV